MIHENTLFTFDDVLIVPKFSTITSRKDVDLSVSTSKKIFYDIGCNFPIVSANMDSVTGENMSKAMLAYGGQACLHRFCSIEDSVKMLENSQLLDDECIYRPMVSIGLGKQELDRASALYFNNATIFVIDVAHGAQLAVAKQVRALKEIIKDNGAIVVGNFATGDSVVEFLEYSGLIQGIKVGIGPGSACTTRIKTGVGYPQLSAVLDVVRVLKNIGIPVIADGGMKTPGDIAKALGAGAHMAMLGGMLSGTDETPGDIIYPEGEKACPVKSYRGSASQESYASQGKTGTHRTSEGDSFLVPCKGSVLDVLQDIEGGLRSAFTYVGARNMEEFHKRCEFLRISPSTAKENGSHGNTNVSF